MRKPRLNKAWLTGTLAFALILASRAEPGHIRVGLFYDYHIRSAVISSEDAKDIYLLVDGQTPDGFPENDLLYVSMVSDMVYVQGTRGGRIAGNHLLIGSRSGRGSFSIRPVDQLAEKRTYRGELHIRPGPAGLSLILHAPMRDYLSGVVKTEGGYDTSPEFYKAQAVLCRTYAFSHMGKHEEEGFDLCDGVHCQAIKGMIPDDHPISLSVLATAGLVVFDSSGELITAGFHSNCGGQTAAGSSVWVGEMPCMQPVSDPYCIDSRNARWSLRLPLDEWMTYLESWNENPEGPGPDVLPEFVQSARRQYYPYRGINIPLKNIREDWKLKSTFFSLHVEGREVVLQGRGNGHGAGMCQEGAMKMAEAGYGFQELIRFYFRDIRIGKMPEPEP